MQVAVDCAEPYRLAEFWAEVLRYEVAEPPDGHESWKAFSAAEASRHGEGWCCIVDPERTGPRVLFHSVPEPKQVKNRVHLDVWVDQPDAAVERATLIRAEADRLLALGATHVRTRDDDGDYYIVLQDPEGNEFCVG